MESCNSIRRNMSKSDIISTIRMSLAADIKNETTFIVVEGLDDVSFLRTKTSVNSTIVESFSGKEGVREIVEFFANNRIVGICDRDYDYVYQNDRVFHYDYSCLEMMLIHNDRTFEAVVGEYYYGGISPLDFRKYLLDELLWLSCLRKLNYQNQWGIRFNGFSLHNVTDGQSFSINTALRELSRINAGFLESHRESITAATILSKQRIDVDALFSITQGHDFICFFHAVCGNVQISSRHSDIDSISASLRCAYNYDDLKETQFYNDIACYENNVQKHFWR